MWAGYFVLFFFKGLSGESCVWKESGLGKEKKKKKKEGKNVWESKNVRRVLSTCKH